MVIAEAYISGTNKAVETGDSYFPMINRTRARQQVRARALLRRGGISKDAPLLAIVNAARWIVTCPDCPNAEFAWEDNLFYCTYCRNSSVDGQLRRVIMPEVRKVIEELLAVRPITFRNWTPNESLDKLRAENLKHLHGLEVI